MLLPSIFGEDLFYSWPSISREFDKAFNTNRASNLVSTSASFMRTDVKELEDTYELSIDLPGFSKEDIAAEIKDGYLTISVTRDSEDQEEKDGVYIRRERYSGSMSRSFYVGEEMTEEDVKAKFNNGILSIEIPKEMPKKEEVKRIISIA